jgi:hypothetical protein
MSKVRECVEWGFRDVITYWSYLDYRRAMQLYKIPVAKYYIVGAFLSNFICLCQGNISSHYFGMPPEDLMTMEQYINLVPIDTHVEFAIRDEEEENVDI